MAGASNPGPPAVYPQKVNDKREVVPLFLPWNIGNCLSSRSDPGENDMRKEDE
jgi:hypothetical protein